MKETDNTWLTVPELAKYLKVSKETVYRWLESKTVPCYRLGKLWRFKRDEIDKWVMKNGRE
jgi:excisionase family DNA binding protein